MERLIADIEQDAIHTAYMTGIKKIDEKVLDAIRSTDRSKFVLPTDRALAYEDHPLGIGFGQTISQPFIVALMTHLIEPQKTDIVLEVGSGSGYLVAVLAKLCKTVYGLELIAPLAERAKDLLIHEKIRNATIVCGDGNNGLPAFAPFNKIIVSAAAEDFPEALIDQLTVPGIMVLPKAVSAFDQVLVRIDKISPDSFKLVDVLPVRFVPLVKL
jgi:protein-L-isoaspartate(D-aspartate) O-methyltransferase